MPDTLISATGLKNGASSGMDDGSGEGLRTGQRAVGIPKIIHQLWKDAVVPDRYAPLVASWRKHHPDWQYRLWTDADLRDFVARHYPDFLAVYDGYRQPISRADAARYLLLRHFGGLYVDLDVECFRPFDELLGDARLVIGLEPAGHLADGKVTARKLDKLICPTVIASEAGHPFWDHVVRHLRAAAQARDPLDATGPFLLTRAYDSFADAASVTVLPSEFFYPLSKHDCWTGRAYDIEVWERVTRAAYALHYWDGSWFRTSDSSFPVFPAGWEVIRVEGSDTTSPPAFEAIEGPPLVSCLMVTRGRFELARLAIESFRRQTYSPLELVIVMDDPEDRLLEAELARIGDPRIRLIRPETEGMSLGRLRNLAVDEARGTYVCQWDDDDLSDPRRIQTQMATLVAARAKGCILSRWMIWMPQEKRMLISHRRAWEGSLICEKTLLPRYPDQRAGEDTTVVEQFRARHTVAFLDMPRLYVYVFHGGNTWTGSHFETMWTSAEGRFTLSRYEAVHGELSKRMPVARYEEIVERTMSRGAAEPAERPLGFNVYGHLKKGLGLSTAARGTLAAIGATGLPHVGLDLEELKKPPAAGEWHDPDRIAPYAINIFHTNPDALRETMRLGGDAGFNERFFANRHNIGYWAWESPTTLPPLWRAWLDRFDEIWVPTPFVAHCLAPQLNVPVIDIPHVVKLNAPQHSRAELGLPESKFLFLCLFDELSGIERKNPVGAIEAFHKAFPEEDGKVGLIVRARSLSAPGRKLLEDARRGRASIEVQVGEADGAAVASLIARCDALLSPHRAEGFGLAIAEAMEMGKPVIATGYSGNLDFMTPDNSFFISHRVVRTDKTRENYPVGTEWAEPNLDHAARLMRALAKQPGLGRVVGRNGAALVHSRYSPAAVASRIEARLRTLIARKALQPKKNAEPTELRTERRVAMAPAAAGEASDLPSVLILTPVRNAARHLPRYFDLLEALDYPASRLSIGLLEGDSYDASYDVLAARLPNLRARFTRAELLKHDHGQQLQGARWAWAAQRRRREKIARVRNRLLSEVLRDEEWVLWLDADLIEYPANLLQQLLATGKDIVVPRCVRPDGRDFDLNSFRFDPTRGPAEDRSYIVDGLFQPAPGRGRAYIGELTDEELAPIDSVGGTALLVRADLHREGLIFPAYSHRGYIETEGLAMMAKDMGYDCWALPRLRIVHAFD